MESTELVKINASQLSAKSFAVDVEAVKKMVANYALLSVSGIDDKTGLKAVREGRLELRRMRIDIEKRGKQLRDDSNAYSKKVIQVERELVAIVAPTEQLLDERETAVTKEVERLAAAKLKDRMDLLSGYRSVIPAATIESMDDKTFHECVEWSRKNYEDARAAEKRVADAEAKRLKEEADAKAREDQRLADERAEFKAQQEEANRKLEAEQSQFRKEQAEAAERQRGIDEANRKESERLKEIARKADEAEAEQRRQQEMDRSKKESAEQAIKDEAERVLKASLDAARKESQRPDKDKLVKLADAIENYPLPELSEQSQAILAAISDDLAQVASNIRDFIDFM